jgi:predicted RNA-binding protein YlxR (DUF448 family)
VLASPPLQQPPLQQQRVPKASSRFESEVLLQDNMVDFSALQVAALHVPRRTRTRTCVGCRTRAQARVDLFRVFMSGGVLKVDLCDKSWGRGAWLHLSTRCIEAACRGDLKRMLGCEVSAAALIAELQGQAMKVLSPAAAVSSVSRSMEVL